MRSSGGLRPRGRAARLLDQAGRAAQTVDDRLCDLLPHRLHVALRTVPALRPHDLAGPRAGQLGGKAQAVALPVHRSAQHIVDRQAALRFFPIDEGRAAEHHLELAEPGQIVGAVLVEGFAEAPRGLVAGEVDEGTTAKIGGPAIEAAAGSAAGSGRSASQPASAPAAARSASAATSHGRDRRGASAAGRDGGTSR